MKVNSLAEPFAKVATDAPVKAAIAPVEPVLSEEAMAKRQKRRDYRERKKLKRQAGVFVKGNENPNVYVSGLPADVTLEEMEIQFKRAGVLKVLAFQPQGSAKNTHVVGAFDAMPWA